jgi:copper homeostasis protein
MSCRSLFLFIVITNHAYYFSGGGKSAPTSLLSLKSLCNKAQKRSCEDPSKAPTILPGSGINPTTVNTVLVALLPLGLQEIHLSGGQWEDGSMSHRPEGMGMGVESPRESQWGVWRSQECNVREVRLITDQLTYIYGNT